MTSVSAKINRVLRPSRSAKRAVYLLLIVLSFALSACGGDEKPAAEPFADSATNATGPKPDDGATGSTSKSGDAKQQKSSSKQESTAGSKAKSKSTTVQVPNNEKPQTESNSTEPSRMALTLNLKNGKFSSTTPTMPIVPSGIQIDLDVYVEDGRTYRLKVSDGTGRVAETPVFAKPGFYTYSRIGVMSVDQVATVTLGKQEIKITAAEDTAGP